MPRIITPGLAYKHLRRYRQVVGILTKYGFGEFFGQIRFWEYVNIEKKLLHREHKFEQLSTAQRLRQALEDLGPTFVKLGQMLSTRPDIVPQNIIVELEKLQNRVAPMPTGVAIQVVESELKKPISEICDSFDATPLAAASLAQVHRASIKGKEVVFKIQRPHITEVIDVDLDIMQNLAVLMDRYLQSLYVINPVGLVREFSENIRREVDFRLEANNMRRFAHNFANTPWVHVPEVFPEHCCTRRVLIMEYIEGINISDIERLEQEGYDLKLLARRGSDISFRSALEHGFFHADPHPGNLLILPGDILCLLDYGMMGRLSTRYRERMGKLLYFMAENDEARTARALLSLIESNEVIDAETLEVDVSLIIQEFSQTTLSEVRLGNVFLRLLQLLQRHNARFPTHLIWLFKSIATLEDVARRLDPEFELVQAARPYSRRLVLKDFNPVHQTRQAYLSIVDSLNFLKDLPYDASIVLDQLKKGRVKIEFEHVGLEPLRKTLHQVTHHIALTLLLAALLISSSLMVLSGVPPLIGSIPVLGVVGFGLSTILAIILIISLLIR